MRPTARSIMVALAGAPLAAVGGCLADDVFLHVLSDNIQTVVLGIADTITTVLFDQAFGLA